MISAAEFKKHISKVLGQNMKSVGFKGSGFNYLMETENFVFTFGIQASQYGGNCCAEFGIQPKEIDSINTHKIDFKKIKYYDCELRRRISNPNGSDRWWTYSDQEAKNIEIANEIFNLFSLQTLPTFKLFKNDPNILDKVEISDLQNVYANILPKLGIEAMLGNVRFAWAMTKVFEKKNLQKAKEFAKYGLSKLDDTSPFFGRTDFEKVIKEN